MMEREKAQNIKVVLEECRKRGVTVEDLLELISVTIGNDSESQYDEKNIGIMVTSCLKELGCPAHIKGYMYLRYAIISAMKDRTLLEQMTKRFYPAIAKEYGTTPTRVERAIRHAIEVTWDRGDPTIFDKYFGYTVNKDKGKPTNSEFLAMIVDSLLLKNS